MPFDRSFRPHVSQGRTLFLSDLHLGALSSRAGLVLRFLQDNPAETYVLVGDILDLWHPLLPHWCAQDQAVIDHLQARARAGARLIYVRGNHDPDPAMIPPHARLKAQHVTSYIHKTAKGKRFLVLHGDEADSRLIRLHSMTRLGSLIDHGLRRCDRVLRKLSRRQPQARGVVDRLLAAANGLRYSGRRYERHMVDLARAKGLDGVICGHFHIAALHNHFGLTYANCGDWVDSMTALEDAGDGVLRRLGGRDYAFGVAAPRPAGRDGHAHKAMTQ
ncbi:UDP-2,3-diacylglucosamine diphosphatase [Roseinatronobacter sp. S2]|uniref:UDP-2,3-diacylglucosamine diphosphatase n=1 Tax=Roseinatronobacter sp. S2 TaxID=3035471 RepID=UPI0024103DD2|nr:UDP-2,3-diacylglucosamine diphosphatase [Roseinatronobacter sp. S2]WFE74695.1 UDP-2,3-diacylglucosamine diphosphatase [Roseinatronobacter sp. S2]